jgi:dolichol-phosphate mannosyltransferase
MQSLTIVTSALNEAENIERFVRTADKFALTKRDVLEVNLIIVDDGSTDGTSFRASQTFHSLNSSIKIRIIRLGSNQGQSIALFVGIQHSNSDLTATMDCDGQHSFEVLGLLLQRLSDNPNNHVAAARQTRINQGPFKKILSAKFYSSLALISGIEIESNVGDFRVFDRQTLDLLKSVRDKTQVIRFILARLKVSQSIVDYEPDKRWAGKTKYSFWRMIKLAGTSISTTTLRPLYLATVASILYLLVSAFGIAYSLFSYMAGRTIPGWTSLQIPMLIGFGVILAVMSIQNVYISRVHEIINDYPRYQIESDVSNN